jgi:Flp pilus assembly protein TadB
MEQVLDRLASRQVNIAVVSSAASGSDTLFIESATRRGWPMFLILPFARQRFREDFSAAEWARVEPALVSATDVHELAAMDSDEQAYLEAGVLTAEQCDVMIAVWDGQAARGPGGTGDIVAHARALQKPLIIINPSTGDMTEERIDALPPSPTRPATGIDNWQAVVDETFNALDDEAKREAPAARWMVLRIVVLHVLAAFIAVASLALHFKPESWPYELANVAKLVALVWALIAALRLRRAHHAWLHSRAAAELCRAMQAIWHLQRRSSPAQQYWLPEVDRLGANLRIAWFIDRAAELPLAEAARDYRQRRLRDQLDYYDRHRDRAERGYRWLKPAANIMTFAAIAAALATMFLHESVALHLAKLLSIVLPLASASIHSLLVSHDIGRRSVRYGEIARRLREIDQQFDTIRTWPSLWRIVAQTESLLLAEVREWQSLSKFGGEH